MLSKKWVCHINFKLRLGPSIWISDSAHSSDSIILYVKIIDTINLFGCIAK